MKLFCEVVADLLPSLRALVAEELMHEYKLSQKEIARRLFVTQPAISQYLRKLRGADRNTLDMASQEIKALCNQIYSSEVAEEELLKRFYGICNSIVAANGHTHEKMIV